MNTLIVYAHPNPKSFNHAVLETVDEALRAQGHETRIRDLYALGFQPVLGEADLAPVEGGGAPPDVQREQQALSWADALVFIYPLWWFDRPAILKGWFDRVFTNGFAFRHTPSGYEGLLRPRKALVIVTTGGREVDFLRMGTRKQIVTPTTDGTLAFCGVTEITDKVLFGIPMAAPEQRQALLDEVRQLATDF